MLVAEVPRRRVVGEGGLACAVAVPRRRMEGGGEDGSVVVVLRLPGTAAGGVGGAKTPACSSVWSARTPTL